MSETAGHVRHRAVPAGLYVKLRRSSDASPYNSAPVIAGHDGNAARLALLHDWLAGHYLARPAAGAELADAAR